MKTCSRCGRPDAPGSSIPTDRNTCNPCRRGHAPTAAPAPRDPVTIIAENRRRAEAARREVEFASMTAHVERLERNIKELSALRSSEPMPDIIASPKRTAKSEVVPLILLSDVHVEERVDKLKMHSTNEYSLSIAKKRMEAFFENSSKLIASAEKTSTVGRVAMGILGDLISGHIHPELMEINALAPGPAVAYAKELIARGLRYWLAQHPGLAFDLYCIGGNHGRLTVKTRIATIAEQSIEALMYGFLAQDFRDEPRVRFHIAPGDMLYADIFPDYRARFIHGDQISYQGGIGGLTVPLTKWIHRANQSIRADMTCLGHWHSCKADRDFLANGSVIGPTTYSQRYGFPPEAPKQQFALIHATRGRTLVADIWCT